MLGVPRYACAGEAKLSQLVRLFAFVGSHWVPKLRNIVINELFLLRTSGNVLPKAVAVMAFELPEAAPPLTLVIAWYVWHAATTKTIEQNDVQDHPDFALALQSMARKHEDGRPIPG